MTALTAAVDVFVHDAALQLDIGGATYVRTGAMAAAINIAADLAARHDVDVGVVVFTCVNQIDGSFTRIIILEHVVFIFRHRCGEH